MLKQWQKLENAINKLLIKLTGLIKVLLIKLTPGFVFRTRDAIVEKLTDWYYVLRDEAIHKFLESKDRSTYLKDQFFLKMEEAQKYPIQEKLKLLAAHVKDRLNRPPKEYVRALWALICHIGHWIDKLLTRFSRGQVLTAVFTVTVFLLSSLMVIQSGRFIYDQEYAVERAPASVEPTIKKPEYYNLDKKTYVVLNIRVPLLVENVKQIKSVTIDFGVRTSNRFTKLYLEEYEHKLKDHFFMTMEPIESSFPLQSEGKNVIREKIQWELNEFLQAEGVEGSIENVTILFIIAT